MVCPNADDLNLSTGRINRLLRPLRNRCATFTAYSRKKILQPASQITYATKTPKLDERNTGPLAILLPPDRIGLKVHFEKHSIESVEMSRKIYAIRDSFQNIVLSTSRGSHSDTPSSRVMFLTTLCSTIVGENIPIDTDASSINEATDELGYDADQILNDVPPQCRRPAILAHALRIILDTTPPHPTLLSILLDVCSAHRLEYLSAIILEALFRSAMHATPSAASAPLCHPNNSLFLVDLYDRWCEAHFTAQAFTRILLDALHTSGVRAVWTSKALGKLSRQLCKADLYPFFQLAGGLAHVITSPTRFPGDVGTEQHTLANWCHQALDRLSTPSLQSPQNADGNHENIGEFLEYVDGIILPSLGSPCDSNLVDAIISLATHWLTLQSAPGTSRPTHFATTLLMLRQTAPRTSTYNRLISNVFSPNIGVSNPKTKDLQQTLQRYASSLRSYDLFHLEASLWASALGHVESSDVESQLASHEGHAAVRNFRYLLIDTVEEVEERCLERNTSGAAVTPLKRKRFVAPQGSYPSHAHTDWRWEKILGCWIQKQSPLKAKTQRKANYIGTAYSPGPLSTIQRLRRKRTNLASSPCKRASLPATTLPAAQNRAGVYEIRVGKGFRSRPSHRSSNFASLLSDAQAHRTVLHPKSSTRRHTKAGLESFHLPISPAIVSPIPRPHSPQGPFKSGIDPQCPPMSDDLMDLFDHPPSSPSIQKPIVRFR